MKNLFVLAIVSGSLVGCLGVDELDDAEAPVAEASEALISSTSTGVFVDTPAGTCTGTLLTNNWVITAKSCGATASSQTTLRKYRYPAQNPDRVIHHPSLNYTLIHAPTAYRLWGDSSTYRQPLYVGAPSALAQRTLTCRKAESTVVGKVVVDSVSPNESRFWFHTVNGSQLNIQPNEAAYCEIESLGGTQYVGIIDQVWWNSGSATMLVNQRRWALESMYPNQNIICHGLECLTTPSTLPNNVRQTASWEPCGGNLRGVAGQYRWDATYNFERDYDFLRITKDGYTTSLTGSGTMSRYPSIASGGTSVTDVGLETDFSVGSAGLTSMQATCMNAAVAARGSVDDRTIARMHYTWQSSYTGGGGGCEAGWDAVRAQNGCGLVIPEPETVIITCEANNYPTRKVRSITVNRPGSSTSVSCGDAPDCQTEVPIDGGVFALCNFVP